MILFAFVLTSFAFQDELQPYLHLEIDEKYVPSFQTLSWLIFVVSTAVGDIGFVVQCLYGPV
jgi:hypothetical protein